MLILVSGVGFSLAEVRGRGGGGGGGGVGAAVEVFNGGKLEISYYLDWGAGIDAPGLDVLNVLCREVPLAENAVEIGLRW